MAMMKKTLSKEAASFLNGMLQYDPKQRLNAEKLNSHHFLTKDYKSLTKMNLSNVQKHLYGANLRINSRKHQNSIWVIFEEDESLNSISGEDMTEPSSSENDNDEDERDKKPQPVIKINPEQKVYQMSEKEIMREFQNAFDEMNDDFIFIEPKLIPIIPGDDPAVISKISEFNEDYF